MVIFDDAAKNNLRIPVEIKYNQLMINGKLMVWDFRGEQSWIHFQ